MRLTVVGCAGSVPSPQSPCSCYLIEADGYRLLLDVGIGSTGPLQQHAAPSDIDAVIISHAHLDHYSDLIQLQYLRNRVKAPPLRIIEPSDLPPLQRIHPQSWDAAHAQAGLLQLGPLKVRLAQVPHGTLETWATRLGDALCYTSDTDPSPQLDELAAGCGVLLAEASGFDAERPPRHMTAGDAGRLAARSGARLLILTHLRSWLDHGELLAEAAAIAPCPVILAHPGLRVAL